MKEMFFGKLSATTALGILEPISDFGELPHSITTDNLNFTIGGTSLFMVVAISIVLISILFLIGLYRAWRVYLKLHSRIEERNRAQNRWFVNMAHELRTPLTLILGPARHLIKKYGDTLDNSAVANIQLIEKNGNRLMNLINEVLDYSQLESGRMMLHEQVINLNSMLNQVVDYFSHSFKQKNIYADLKLPSKDIYLRTDGRKVETILMNLVSNALKFTERAGNIKIICEEKEDQIWVSVIDSGQGIKKEDIDRIFDKFYQVEQAHDTISNEGGSGIGLALSKEMVQLLNGEIRVFSRLGMGSKFTLVLPSSLKTASDITSINTSLAEVPESKKIRKNTPSRHTSGQHILLVEDNLDMQEYITSILTYNNVSVAKDGEMALQMLADDYTGVPFEPDLIISDVIMPRMDGYTFHQKFKELFPERRIPFVLLTAKSGEADKIKGFEMGVSDYITKPFSQEEFVARINNLLLNSTYRKKISKITVPTGVVLTDDEALPPSYAENLLNKIKQEVETRMSDNQLSVDTLADVVGMHKKTLTRTLKKALGLTPGKFIRELRLRRALRYLESGTFQTVNEVAQAVGFESPSNFTYAFFQRYGKKPSEYLRQS